MTSPDPDRRDSAEARRQALRLKLEGRPLGAPGRIARVFLESKLTPLLVVASLLLGGFAILATPREEEPQIRVPMIDVFVGLPGATAEEAERRAVGPIERAIAEIEDVEYVYSTSRPSGGMVIARFVVGADPDRALSRVQAKVAEAADELPSGAAAPRVVARSIDDVPVVAYTLWSTDLPVVDLTRVADEVAAELRRHPRVSEVTVLGARRRALRIDLDRDRLAVHGLAPLQVLQSLGAADRRLPAGAFAAADGEVEVDVGARFSSAEGVAAAVISVVDGHVVTVGDLATVTDGPEEPVRYAFLLSGAAAAAKGLPAGLDAPAVTLAVAKKPGSNAVDLVADLDGRLAALAGPVLPEGVEVTKTRDYGATADAKSTELMEHLALATLAVIVLMAFALGRREAVVVAVAVPTTLALTLASSYLFGYTLNRVTLFALIFAIGILVDDAIVVVENIHRHLKIGWTHPRHATVFATDEVGNPTLLATLTVVAALLPLALVTGLMGPYMRPIPINASAAMLFSLAVAFVVSPWLAYRLFRRQAEAAVAGEGAGATLDGAGESGEAGDDTRFSRLYTGMMRPLLARPGRRWALLGAVALALAASVGLFALRAVKVKMLPFDNKSEVQVVLDLPEGATLERTAAAARRLGAEAATLPEVTDVEVYVGTSAPFNFNGLVRHYFLREGPAVADLQVNLVGKGERDRASHDFAVALRDRLAPLALQLGVDLKVAEVPPGPPVLATLVAEIYGPDLERRVELAGRVRELFTATPGVVDIDWLVEASAPRVELAVDQAKALRAGLSAEAVAATVRLALAGQPVGWLRDPAAREPVPIVLRLRRDQRSGIDGLLAIAVPAAGGGALALSEVVAVVAGEREKFIYHKNLLPVTYVLAEVAREIESPVYGILDLGGALAGLEGPDGAPVPLHFRTPPEAPSGYAMKWDGEWQITYEVFRDLGVAFAGALVLIYLLVVGWFRSFVTPLVIMAPIPLTLIGILPAHALGGVFFTATSMIGFIALAGIIVRNSILLVDFIHLELAAGESLEDAVVRAAIVRFRPIALTAAALVVGGLVILLDPIFQGLAVALISGVVVATGLTLVVIPLLYHMYLRRVGVATVVGSID